MPGRASVSRGQRQRDSPRLKKDAKNQSRDCHVKGKQGFTCWERREVIIAEGPREPVCSWFHVFRSLDTSDDELFVYVSVLIANSARYQGCPCHP